jgi:hypothetical protein
MCRKMELCELLYVNVECKMVQPPMEESKEVPPKIKKKNYFMIQQSYFWVYTKRIQRNVYILTFIISLNL